MRKRRYNKIPDVEGEAANKAEVKESAPEDMKSKSKDKDRMKGIHYYNLTNTIDMLSRNVRDLDERLTKYKTKQVKLKGKYKELKRAIYEDDDDEYDEIETVTKPVSEAVMKEEIKEEVEEVEEPEAQSYEEFTQPQHMRRSRRFNFGLYF